ncbi:hypothetical protein AA101099_2990 [Neoasaia chiangmaiensis NBRC 101099]|uniref:Uncharacterized protein n=1 Tax=Neoasaia chiangmaiensis TaxID=320497 RepID=A0A1U9KNN6_9PROT|nr:DUF4412 domain-containing protein [Neoasaia chiangmaiensis]AQS87417.1 hypothetical protein A0U93_05095 [Neoasaia chiangmaiensis]GBR42797.1 hypothetical protein AA101099_2990 [Neoasaia chiangmaiensis NBRC 101099]GEN16189.1 hypothetical protein NCH01_26200 [Neoasaia chiangmaiensis]
MHSFFYGLGAAMCVTALSAPCLAQSGPHPQLAPTRDVTVVYAVQPQGAPAPQQVTVSFAKDGDRLRIDEANKIGATVLDRPAQQVMLIMNKQRMYMQFSPQHGLRNPFLLDLSMHYTPAGQGNVAGLVCDKWTIATTHGAATACVTQDGVILSEFGADADGAQGTLTAQNVQYGPIDPTLFQPPAGYEKITSHMPIPHNPHPATGVTAH